ncbi:MAG: hypothetical protein Q9206_000107 [Seirophora lacunosa]
MDLDVGAGRGFAQPYEPPRQRKKIYRMLDRSNGLDAHYYQPGIGTYVNTHNLSHTSLTTRLISWYKKAKDSAVGTSFDSHVMGGYKFLMKCYQDDDIFIFGFSRGAYVARFLAEMLDHVGLLSNGNEEMAYFAWKAFSQWQEREEGSDEDKKKKEEMYQHLKAFRETFSRPVRRIRFLGLFDTDTKAADEINRHQRHHHHHKPDAKTNRNRTARGRDGHVRPKSPQPNRFRRRSQVRPSPQGMKQSYERHSTQNDSQLHARPTTSEKQQMRSLSPGRGQDHDDLQSLHSRCSLLSLTPREDEYELDEAANQDIEELWYGPSCSVALGPQCAIVLTRGNYRFPGCHADLGGGWPLDDLNECALSHPPLVWMIREAQRAGLELDDEQMLNLHCRDEDPRMLDATFPSTNPAHQQQEWEQQAQQQQQQIPTFQVTTPSQPNIFRSPHSEHAQPGWHAGLEPEAPKPSEFHRRLHHAATRSTLHDCLKFNNGLPRASVLSWKIMEYLPFRRMDLQPDGSWKAITLPLPMGEVRDIPEDAKIHHSAIRRMEADENYRPGNLIVGGGGRGVRKAPAELGIGEWMVHNNKGDPVGEVVVRKVKSLNKEMKEEGK